MFLQSATVLIQTLELRIKQAIFQQAREGEETTMPAINS
jgi:hypothetical protein